MTSVRLQRHPFLRLVLALAGGIACGDVCAQPDPEAGFLVLAVALAVATGVCFWRPRWLGTVSLLWLFAFGFLHIHRCQERHAFPFPEVATAYRVCIDSPPEEKPRSLMCDVSLTAWWDADADRLTSARRQTRILLYLPKDSASARLKRGDVLWIQARIRPPQGNHIPEAFDYARYLRRHGVSGTAYVPAGHWQVCTHHGGRTLRQAALDQQTRIVDLYRRLGFEGDELAVLAALTVGDKDELSDDIVETYSVSGASHVLALSGLHIGFLYGLLWLLMAPLWRRWHGLKPWLLGVIVLALWAFAFVTGLSPSVVRSVTMFSLLAAAALQPERPVTLNTLSATAFLMLLMHPVWLFDVGFQMSFMAVAAIVLWQKQLYRLLPVKNRLLRYPWGLLTVSVAAQMGVAPLVILYFSRFSTHFLLTNLWVVPVSSVVMYGAVALLMLTPLPMLQQPLALMLDKLVHLQNQVLQGIEQLPYASIDHLWTDTYEVCLLYLCLWLAGEAMRRVTARRIYCCLLAGLLLATYHTWNRSSHRPTHSIAFYDIRDCPSVHCIEASGRSWLACTDSQPDDTHVRRTLQRHWDHLRLPGPTTLHKNHTSDSISYNDQIVCYAGRRICMVNDNRWRNRQSQQKLTVDYLYIAKGFQGQLDELLRLFNVRQVILDGSLTDFYRKRLMADCQKMGLPYLRLEQHGIIEIEL